MSKRVFATTAPNDILNELIKYPTIANDDLLLDYLAKANNVLSVLSQHQFERCVPDELAGTIATIIGMVCINHSEIPVIMVTSTTNKNAYILMLGKIVEALQELGHLPAGYGVTEKHSKSKCFCMRRFKNACVNGADYKNTISHNLLVETLDEQNSKKLCVQACSKSCRYYATCKYQRLLAHMNSGDAKLQVYSDQQYRSALNAKKLPKSRMVLYSAYGKRILTTNSSNSLTEAEIKSLLSRCEIGISTLQKHRETICRLTLVIRAHSDILYVMAFGGLNEDAAKRHLAVIVEGLKALRVECINQVKKPERTPLFKELEKMIKKCTAMLECELDVTHKNQGKRALVAA